jgi:hypothetical protein
MERGFVVMFSSVDPPLSAGKLQNAPNKNLHSSEDHILGS